MQFIFVELKTNLLKLKQIFPLSSPSRIKEKFIPFFISYIVRFFLRQFLCYNVTPMSYFPWRHLLFIFLNEVKTIFVFEYVRYPWRPFNHLKTLNAEASRKVHEIEIFMTESNRFTLIWDKTLHLRCLTGFPMRLRLQWSIGQFSA